MNQKMMLMAFSALVLAVVTGWLLASSGTVAAQSNGTQPQRCVPSFYVPEVRADGLALLVEQCSGTTWFFDDGWDGLVKVGEPTWRRVRWGQSN